MRVPAILALGLVAAVATAGFAEIKSGPQVGDRIGTYTTKKCNDVADGVKEGQRLCYT